MLDNLKMMGAVAGLLKNRDGIKQAGDRIQSRLDAMRITGACEGGLVRATVTGKMQVLSIEVSDALAVGLASKGDRSMAERLIADAVNDAIRQAHVAVTEAIDEEGVALGLPGLGDQLSQILPR